MHISTSHSTRLRRWAIGAALAPTTTSAATALSAQECRVDYFRVGTSGAADRLVLGAGETTELSNNQAIDAATGSR